MAEAEKFIPKILIADDDPEMRRMLRLHLETMDCQLVEAKDGEEALEAIVVENPDLVLLDVMMPELNGWEIAKYIKSKAEYRHVKIIILTGIGATLNNLTAPVYGADDFIDKPFNLDELEFKIRRALSRRNADG